MFSKAVDRLGLACQLMNDFALRTGLTDNGGNLQQRYLWTDAFAVQTFFNLFHLTDQQHYFQSALKLIDAVHQTLGRFHLSDKRKGWISGLEESEGSKHPTIAGLRIGKKMLERIADEFFDEQLEWERDGQYFHYLTRWMQALLQAAKETGDKKYATWAKELFLASAKFIYKKTGDARMYWKMSTDLQRPLIYSMGAHDPMEGLVCGVGILQQMPEEEEKLKTVIKDFENCCQGMQWSTSDSLGIGGLLLNAKRVIELSDEKIPLPACIHPEILLKDCLEGLQHFKQMHQPNLNARYRLAFRECGLSFGLREILPMTAASSKKHLEYLSKIKNFSFLADEIEAFWIEPEHQKSASWTEHLDINAVTLAASLAINKQTF